MLSNIYIYSNIIMLSYLILLIMYGQFEALISVSSDVTEIRFLIGPPSRSVNQLYSDKCKSEDSIQTDRGL